MTAFRHNPWLLFLFALLAMQINGNAQAFTNGLGPMPISLKELPVPQVPGLLDGSEPIVIDKNAAIALGKALFWDTNVGSDGMACGSCHFHAGADSRTNNQVSPGSQSTPASDRQFDSNSNSQPLGPNHNLSLSDFPLHQRQKPLVEISEVKYDTANVVGSSGTFSGEFKTANRSGTGVDSCSRSVDDIFHVGSIGTRRVTPRNAPSVINAIFNHRSFWDGRANNVFNGSSPWGDRDPNAGVWIESNSGTVSKQPLHLINSSLASLAMGPPLNTTEMACSNRSMMNIGRKLLHRKPLQNQKVHAQDSVLGPYSLSTATKLKPGLNTTYKNLITKAFSQKYWAYNGNIPMPAPARQQPYKQMEANFGMFFGLAIQLYESTLISDESPFDKSARDTNQQPIDLTASELNGLDQFRMNLCSLCHIGPNFTAASVNANAALNQTRNAALNQTLPDVFGEPGFFISTTTNVVERIPVLVNGTGVTTFYDTGFASTGVADEASDVGVGGVDDFGNPLSFSKQYLQHLVGNNSAVKDGDVSKVRACDFQEEFAVNFMPSYLANSMFTLADGIQPQPQDTANCFLSGLSNAFLPKPAVAKAELDNPNTQKMLAEVKASFKTPTLRNIELTGPYMHNGSMATLDQVIEFYTRGGNFKNNAKQVTRVFQLANLQFSKQNRDDLVAFLKTLTDDRVRYQKAPFDHPEIKIPHGHIGNEQAVNGKNSISRLLAKDNYQIIEAVGANGTASALKPFDSYLAP
jgi:cytochrome c peroxidase